MKYKILSFLSIFIFSVFMLLLTGCSDATQLNQKLFIQGIGIDIEDNRYKITLQALDFQNLKKENEPAVRLIELFGKTLSEALESATKKTGLIPLYSQNLIIVIGDDAARKGVNNFIDFFIRHYEARPNVKICVSNSTASDILKFEDNGELMSAKNIQDLIPKDINSDILHFVGNLQNETSDPFCAALGVSIAGPKRSLSISGIAVFSEDKLLDVFEDNDYMGILLALGVGDIGIYTISLENIGNLSVGINKVSRDVSVNVEGNKEFNINIDINSVLVESDRGSQSKIGKSEQKKINQQLATELENISQQSINKIINLNSDIFGLGRILLKSNLDYFIHIKDTWKKTMKEFVYNININSNISVTGTEI